MVSAGLPVAENLPCMRVSGLKECLPSALFCAVDGVDGASGVFGHASATARRIYGAWEGEGGFCGVVRWWRESRCGIHTFGVVGLRCALGAACVGTLGWTCDLCLALELVAGE